METIIHKCIEQNKIVVLKGGQKINKPGVVTFYFNLNVICVE